MSFRFLVFTIVIVIHSLAGAKVKNVDQESSLKSALEINSDFSHWIDRKVNLLDLALSGERYTTKKENSEATLAQRFNWSEVDGLELETDFDLHLALPNLEKKYKIIFSSYNEEKTRRSAYSRFRQQDRERTDYGAGLAFLSKIGDFDITFRPRIQFGNPFQTFYTLKFESEAKLGRHRFQTRFDLFADSQKGTGQFVSLTYKRIFWRHWGDSIVLEEEYQDGENIFSLLQGYSIYRILSKNITLTQSIVVSSDNEMASFRLKDISTGPSLTHELYPDFFHYSVVYTHSFNREYFFRGKSTVSLLCEFIF